MVKTYNIIKQSEWLSVNEYIRTLCNDIFAKVIQYKLLYNKSPNIYINDEYLFANEYIMASNKFRYNTNIFDSNLVGTLNGYNLIMSELIELGKFCICDDREFNILKRKQKINKILNRI